jgi:hypothetical protein
LVCSRLQATHSLSEAVTCRFLCSLLLLLLLLLLPLV